MIFVKFHNLSINLTTNLFDILIVMQYLKTKKM